MSEMVYRSGKQRIQREAILETGGSAAAPDPDDGNYRPLNCARIEADFKVATAEEYAKRSPGHSIPCVVGGTVYTVTLE